MALEGWIEFIKFIRSSKAPCISEIGVPLKMVVKMRINGGWILQNRGLGYHARVPKIKISKCIFQIFHHVFFRANGSNIWKFNENMSWVSSSCEHSTTAGKRLQKTCTEHPPSKFCPILSIQVTQYPECVLLMPTNPTNTTEVWNRNPLIKHMDNVDAGFQKSCTPDDVLWKKTSHFSFLEIGFILGGAENFFQAYQRAIHGNIDGFLVDSPELLYGKNIISSVNWHRMGPQLLMIQKKRFTRRPQVLVQNNGSDEFFWGL